jgi:hypothetical protein
MNECYYMGMSLMTLFMGLFPTVPSSKVSSTEIAPVQPAYLSIPCEAVGEEAQYQSAVQFLFPKTGESPQFDKGFSCLDASAKAGHPKAQLYLGMAFNQGSTLTNAQGALLLPQNKVQARYWLQESAKAGEAEAQALLAQLYETGLGGRQDLTLARYWYEKSARQGVLNAQKRLAYFYEKGLGVAVNPETAYYWWRIAQVNQPDDASLALQVNRLKKQIEASNLSVLESRIALWKPLPEQQFSKNLKAKLSPTTSPMTSPELPQAPAVASQELSVLSVEDSAVKETPSSSFLSKISHLKLYHSQ